VAGAALSDEKSIWSIVIKYAKATSLGQLTPHDLCRTCAKLCRKAGGDLEQIQLLLGYASIQTTERYLSTEQNLTTAVNDAPGVGAGVSGVRSRSLAPELLRTHYARTSIPPHSRWRGHRVYFSGVFCSPMNFPTTARIQRIKQKSSESMTAITSAGTHLVVQ
jgi:Phage integrase family